MLTFRKEMASLVDSDGHASLVRTRQNISEKTHEFVFQPHRGSTATLDTIMHACAAMVNRVHGPGVVMPRVDRELPGHFMLVVQNSWFTSSDSIVATDAVFFILTPLVAAGASAFLHMIIPSN